MNTMFGVFVAIAFLIAVALALRQAGIFYTMKAVRLVAEKNSIALTEERLNQMLGGVSFFTLFTCGLVFSIFWFRKGLTDKAIWFAAQCAEESMLPILRGDECECEPEEDP